MVFLGPGFRRDDDDQRFSPMNLRHIEIFHAVYVKGSASAAARALNVSQPSVSNRHGS